MHITPQFASDIIGTNKNKQTCIQLLKMQEYALRIDFSDDNRRKKYFSTENIKFFDNHKSKNMYLDVNQGDIICGKEKQKIVFLKNPLCQALKPSDIINKYYLLRYITNSTIRPRDGDPDKTFYGYYSQKYDRKPNENLFTPSGDFKRLIYKEVMFVKKGGYIYIAPNDGDNIKLSHPSLLGGYPYEVDDAGVLRMKNGIVTAYNDSGHYGKYDNSKNVEMTNKLNPQITKKDVVKPKIVTPVLSNSTTRVNRNSRFVGFAIRWNKH